MTDTETQRRKAIKRRFLIGGAATGMLLGIGYVALTLSGRTLQGTAATPDPPGIICVNMFLILAVCIIQSSILGRLAGWLTRPKSESPGVRPR